MKPSQTTENLLPENEPSPPKLLGFRRSALVEIGVFFVVSLLLDWVFFDGTRFASIKPHPFWMVVLLIACQYGTREALLACAASTLFLYVGGLPEPGLRQDPHEFIFGLVLNPLQWFLAALVLGEIRMRHIQQRQRLQNRLAETLQREKALAASNEALSLARNRLEARLAGHMRSAITAHEAARAIERLEPNQVLDGVMEMVRTVLAPERYSLFLLRGNALELSRQAGWGEEAAYSRVFHADSTLFREIVGRQKLLCCANEEDEKALAGEGMLASPICSPESGEVIGMLKIEELDFLELNLSNIAAFRSLCEWVAATYANARLYQAARAGNVINSETKLPTYHFFQNQTQFLKALARRFGFDLSAVVLRLENAQALNPDLLANIPVQLGEFVKNSLRRTDLVFDYEQAGTEFAFILPGNSADNSQVLVDKVMSHLKAIAPQAQFSAISVVMHQAQAEVGHFGKGLLPRGQNAGIGRAVGSSAARGFWASEFHERESSTSQH